MRYYSPLRYPGGKQKIAKFIASICELNNITGHYVEPYAGGASVALYLLLEGHVREITINDLDISVYAFWYSVLNNTLEFCDLIEKTAVTVSEWKKQKATQDNKREEHNLLKLGFSTFFLNRTNYSGVLNAGPIGGLQQNGPYKIDCRFNKGDLINRIKLIADQKEFIHIENLNAIKLIKKIKKNNQTIFYFDPPYYLKGQSLYMNAYKHCDHQEVSDEIKKIKNARWIVSYDNVKAVQELYRGSEKINYSFNHSVRTAREGKEVVFFSRELLYPKVLNPVKLV